MSTNVFLSITHEHGFKSEMFWKNHRALSTKESRKQMFSDCFLPPEINLLLENLGLRVFAERIKFFSCNQVVWRNIIWSTTNQRQIRFHWDASTLEITKCNCRASLEVVWYCAYGLVYSYVSLTFWRVQSFKKHIKRQICLLCWVCFQTFPAVEFLRKKMKRSVGGWRISRMRKKFPELGTAQYTSPHLNDIFLFT